MHTTVRCTLLIALIALAGPVRAQEKFDPAARADAIAPLLDELAIGVVHVDLERIEVDWLVDKIVECLPEMQREGEEMRTGLKRLRTVLFQNGFPDVYIVVSLADLPRRFPFLIAPVTAKSDVPALLEHVRKLQAPSLSSGEHFELLGDVLFLGDTETLARLKGLEPTARPELANAFKAAGDTTVQVLLLPPPHTRRVIEEMMPELPEEVGGGPSTILTRGLLWAAVSVEAVPQTSLRMVVQSQDAAAAAALREKLTEALQILIQKAITHDLSGKFDAAQAVLTPAVNGDRLTLTLDEENRGIATLIAMLTPPLDEARGRAHMAQAISNIKHLGLAMHNWHSSHKSFPAQANYDASGKPLLSWRVHLLRYLDAQKLYEQFHLDEPWDSEHNRKLIDKMPDVYRGPASKLKEKGRASYLLPIGPDTVFPGREGIPLKEIKDGASNTIMIVEVDDDHAVIWTKPEDLPFDPADPERGLGGQFEGGAHVTICDGSVTFLTLPNDAEILRALFTRDGGEVNPR